MCGIIGYTGTREAIPVLLDGLKKLEYRGYDSAGIAYTEEDGQIETVKTSGRIACLEEKIKERATVSAHTGIGHTRWATHGAPTDRNAHPHSSGKVTLVHNGIIENYDNLRQKLIEKGYTFVSETDTEVIACLLSELYQKLPDPRAALHALTGLLTGSYALAVLFADYPETVWAIRKGSPLIVGYGDGEAFLASDIPALLGYTRRVSLIEEGEIAALTTTGIVITDENDHDKTGEKEIRTIDWDAGSAEKGGYAHFMLKEIYEQPETLRRAVACQLANGARGIFAEELPLLGGIRRIWIVGCGSAMHSGMVGKVMIESLARIPVSVSVASEFRYEDPILFRGDLVILISQSGETADTLAALRLAKDRGAKTCAIVNVVGSSIAREADSVLYLKAGPEIAVATTKAFSSQVAILDLLALRLAAQKRLLTKERETAWLSAFARLPACVTELLQQRDALKESAKLLCDAQHIFFLGRGRDAAVCLEGSLKLKEISYIHSEAYAAGELKHGTISLITEGVPCVCVMTSESLAPKTIGNLKEVRARGAKVVVVCTPETADFEEGLCDKKLILPSCEPSLAPIPAVILLQMLAYETALLCGCDIDKPRNLAKSVTVE